MPLATGLHQVDNPAFDAAGNLYVTFSGSRGQQPPVSVYKVGRDGARVPFVTDLSNATSLAFDREGRLHVSSRFDGSVHRVDARRPLEGRRDRPRRRLRHRLRPGRRPVRRRSLRLDPARRRRADRDRRHACRRASRRSTSRSGPTAISTSRRRRSRRPTACIGSRRPATSSAFGAPFGRPQGLAFDTRRPALRRRRAGRQLRPVQDRRRPAVRGRAAAVGRLADRARLRAGRRAGASRRPTPSTASTLPLRGLLFGLIARVAGHCPAAACFPARRADRLTALPMSQLFTRKPIADLLVGGEHGLQARARRRRSDHAGDRRGDRRRHLRRDRHGRGRPDRPERRRHPLRRRARRWSSRSCCSGVRLRAGGALLRRAGRR